MTNADARAALDEAFKARIGRLYDVLASDVGLRSVAGVDIAPPDQAFTRGLRQTRAAYEVAARQIDLIFPPEESSNVVVAGPKSVAPSPA